MVAHRVCAVCERLEDDVGRTLGAEREGALHRAQVVGSDSHKLPAAADVLPMPSRVNVLCVDMLLSICCFSVLSNK